MGQLNDGLSGHRVAVPGHQAMLRQQGEEVLDPLAIAVHEVGDGQGLPTSVVSLHLNQAQK